MREFQNLLMLLFWRGQLKSRICNMNMLERHQLRTSCPISGVSCFTELLQGLVYSVVHRGSAHYWASSSSFMSGDLVRRWFLLRGPLPLAFLPLRALEATPPPLWRVTWPTTNNPYTKSRFHFLAFESSDKDDSLMGRNHLLPPLNLHSTEDDSCVRSRFPSQLYHLH